MTPAPLALERRRQVLLATIALQRFALRSDLAALRRAWPVGRAPSAAPALLAGLTLANRWLLPRSGRVAGLARLLAAAALVHRSWPLLGVAVRWLRSR